MDTIVLTGASSGIGAALAVQLSRPGRTLILIGRNGPRLSDVQKAVEQAGAICRRHLIDIRDREQLSDALKAEDANGPIDLVIANAGISAGLGPERAPESPEDARRLIDINLIGMLNTIEPILTGMRSRKSGHIVLVSSIAGLMPHPDMPTYSATKAAVRAYGIALRGWLAPLGIAVTVISPGFVTSPMSARHVGFKPFEISAERAAMLIARGLERRVPLVTFPWPLVLLTWLGNRLPPTWSDLAMRGFATKVLPERED